MTLERDAIIFDLDGVLVDSQQVVEKHWKLWAEQHELHPEEVMKTVHGRRTIDAISKLKPDLDAREEANKLADREAQDTDGLKIYPGVRETLLNLLTGTWAVATSGTEKIARTRLEFADIPEPEVFITAEDVEKGKPNPEVFLRAAKGLDVSPSQCIVFEDTPPGIQAALNADMSAIAVHTTYKKEQLEHATAVIPDLSSVEINMINEANLEITLLNSLQ